MCYLVTSYPPPKDGQLKLLLAEEYDDDSAVDPLPRAVSDAEARVLCGHSSVRVWKLHGSPELIQVVKWNQDS